MEEEEKMTEDDLLTCRLSPQLKINKLTYFGQVWTPPDTISAYLGVLVLDGEEPLGRPPLVLLAALE